jgi:hypothetical protein
LRDSPPVAAIAPVAAVTAITPVTEAPSAAAIPAAPAAQHDRLIFFQLIDAYRQITDHVFADAHVALHLQHRVGGRIDVEQHVVALAVLLDPIGQGLEAPVFLLRDLASVLLDQLGELVG